MTDTPPPVVPVESEKASSPAAKPTKAPTATSAPAPAPRANVRTEAPVEPPHIYRAFERDIKEEAIIGNPAYVMNLKLEGKLGTFYERENAAFESTAIEFNLANYRNAVFTTISDALTRLLRQADHIEQADIAAQVDNVATQLANGVVIMTYLKTSAVNAFDYRFMSRFYRRPKVPTPFMVPSPYALAISQLGQLRVSGLTTEVIYTPMFTEATAQTFGLSANQKWSSTNYCQAMEYAKKLGMQFSTVDLTVKMGSSWWLYRPVEQGDILTLQCPAPEENFTETTAVLYTLFCVDADGGSYNPIFDLTPVGTNTYGTMLRDPPDRVDLSTFFAVEGTSDVVWKVA